MTKKTNKLENIGTDKLLKEVQSRLDNKSVSRKDLLQLARVNWCLECGKNDGNLSNEGFCQSCEQDK